MSTLFWVIHFVRHNWTRWLMNERYHPKRLDHEMSSYSFSFGDVALKRP